MTTNKVCIITGASSGLGEEFAQQISIEIAKRQMDVNSLWLIARNQERLELLAEKLRKQMDSTISVQIFSLDLDQSHFPPNQKEPDPIQTLINTLESESRKTPIQVSWLICNAGFGALGDFEKIDFRAYRSMTEVNVLSPAHLIHSLDPYYSDNCHILPVASSAGFSPIPYFAYYAATKAFLIHLCLAISYEWKNRKRHFTIVVPGPIKTGFFNAAQNWSPPGESLKQAPAFATSAKWVVSKALKDAKRKKLFSYDNPIIRLLCWIGNVTPVKLSLTIMARFKKQL